MMSLIPFYKGKKVFITGFSGFKGSWLCVLLKMLDAEVYGYALTPASDTSMFGILGIGDRDDLRFVFDDVRDFDALERAYVDAAPDIVLHLAAQPIVRESYRIPRETYETNVMGTVNLLECVRKHLDKDSLGYIPIRSFLNVTTDKVYENPGTSEHAFREDERLDGYDPYSNSKSCSELVTETYRRSFFFGEKTVPISTARAGNVIGGGDFAADRIIPDCVRAVMDSKPIAVRNPGAVRPYQHVLEPVVSYLSMAMEQAEHPENAGSYNIGPDEHECLTTGEVADLFCRYWRDGAEWVDRSVPDAPHEAGLLRLDASKAKETFGIHPVWTTEKAIEKTVEWYKAWIGGEDMLTVTERQIGEYLQAMQI